MKEIPDSSIDLILCDLPYGITCNKWDVVIPFEPLWEQYKRIRKKKAQVLLFGQQPFSSLVVTSNMKEFRYEWIYEKTNSTGFLNANKMPLKCHESILVFYDELPTYNPQFVSGKPYNRGPNASSTNYGKFITHTSRVYTDKRYPRDVLKFENSSNNNRGLHPNQKPVELLEYLIKTYTNAGDMVLDNCMGSGSTGLAAVNTNRNFIGIEQDERYFEIARERIAKSVEKLQMEAGCECL